MNLFLLLFTRKEREKESERERTRNGKNKEKLNESNGIILFFNLFHYIKFFQAMKKMKLHRQNKT